MVERFPLMGLAVFFLFVRMKFRPLRNLIRFGLSTKYINMGLFIKIMVGSSRLLDYVNRSTFEQISSPWCKRESCTVFFFFFFFNFQTQAFSMRTKVFQKLPNFCAISTSFSVFLTFRLKISI